MKVILYNAISLDGFIAGPNDDTDWVDDDIAYFSEAKKVGAVITGRKTFDPNGEEYTVPDCVNYVYTKTPDRYKNRENVKFIGGAPGRVLEEVKRNGFESVLVVGGGECNYSFLQADLIDELILDIHPVFIGSGTKLFGTNSVNPKLELISTKKINNGIIQNRYKVIKG